jgi:hypothetical protein
VGAANRYCHNCGNDLLAATELKASPGFCRQCGAALEASHRFCTSCGARVAPPGSFVEATPGAYPLRYNVPYPEKLSRLLIFVKWLLAIPHFLVVLALGYAVAAITVVAFFAILFTRRYPRGLFNLVVGVNRWGANVTAYTYLFRDEYPPFSVEAGRYPVLYEVDYPERLNRWLIFVKWLLVIPHQFVLTLLSVVGFFFAFLSWFAILFTGKYPRTFFNFNVGLQRWTLRVGAYSALLRDEFPPYSKRADAKPGSGRAILLSAVFGIVGAAVIAGLYVALLFAFSPGTEVVDVSYEGLLTGRETRPVDIQGTIVVLEGAVDPYEPDLASRDKRFVAYDVRVTNDDSWFTFVDVDSFELEDNSGDSHDPDGVFLSGFANDYVLEQGEEVVATVVFEIDEADDPESLTYSPMGPIAFGPIGGDVRFEFR